jgi:sugar lactone lactonase YvrE
MKKITILISCFAMIAVFTATSQTITTVAGNGTGGFSGDGGLATSATLFSPNGVAFDKTGNYYFTDEQNNRVRKVDISTGIITTVAGNGTSAYSGDGGAATSASLNWPIGVVVDDSGNIYIGDFQNNVVRKVYATTGKICTVAGNGTAGFTGDGGPAISAELNATRFIALDSVGNLYIADANNNRIRKIIKSTGIISTIAGTGIAGFSGDGGLAGAAELNYPYGIVLDKKGNVYVADQANNRIREINISTGIINTVAGNGTAGYTGDGGMATSAELHGPNTMTVGLTGNILISDTYNQVIRKVFVSSGIITTIAGNGIAGYSGDGGPATSAQLHYPAGIVLQKGDLYIPDWGNNRIRKIVYADPQGINEISVERNIVIYPNPASNQLSIAMNGLRGVAALYNVLGEQVTSQSIPNKETITINLSGLAPGIYIVKIVTEEGNMIVRKVEISR